MPRGKKFSPTHSAIVMKLFSQVPTDVKDQILKEKKSVLNRYKDHIRAQTHLPIEVYTILRYWGAFDDIGESGFLSNLASQFMHKRAIELGLLGEVNSNGAH